MPLEGVHGDEHKVVEEQKVIDMQNQQKLRNVMEEHEEQNEIDKEDQKDMNNRTWWSTRSRRRSTRKTRSK